MEYMYLKMVVKFDVNGFARPVFFMWDGEKQFIDRVKYMTRVYVAKSWYESDIICYLCMVKGEELKLYLHSGRWYMTA